MKVIATAKGFYGDEIRLEGEEFDYEGPPCSWCKPVEEDEKPKRGRPKAALDSETSES